MKPVDVEIRVRESKEKGNGYFGKFTVLEVPAKRLQTRKEEAFGREKQTRPEEMESKEEEGAQDSEGGRGRDRLRQVLRIVS